MTEREVTSIYHESTILYRMNLIKIICLLWRWTKHLTTSHIRIYQVTCHSSFIFQSYSRQLNILTNRTSALTAWSIFNTSRFGNLVVGWWLKILPWEDHIRVVVRCLFITKNNTTNINFQLDWFWKCIIPCSFFNHKRYFNNVFW